ncbi:carbohydrate ABC transporter permease [Amphibacillus cookii]|uniref:carbohydrate ABC transporter permease n=1 Tax=Amphibacillus cookii TaxID=767787 RepID=UPI00195C4C6D|nr:carbohydrate ABC transporter permease [Amphibacillus cookii]MBM7541563.1 putative aldouronate transport system permease protein [Amphibacillus cookii]
MSDMHKLHNTKPGRVFDVINIIFLAVAAIVTLLPFIYVVAGSFATESELARRAFFIIPETFTLEAYRYIFTSEAFIRSIVITIGVTAVGTAVQLFFTFTMAYPLAKRSLRGRKLLINIVIFAMLFSGGMIPTFLVVQGLGLIDTYWALILPNAINPFNLIIIKNFFQNFSVELEESAKIDGASEIGIFWRIVLPLSKPIIATFALFYAVAIWNDFMSPLLYLNDSSKWTLQLLLRQVTISSDPNALGNLDPDYVPPAEGMKLAIIVIATLPIMTVYPFLQKHFAKGLLIGSVKG